MEHMFFVKWKQHDNYNIIQVESGSCKKDLVFLSWPAEKYIVISYEE